MSFAHLIVYELMLCAYVGFAAYLLFKIVRLRRVSALRSEMIDFFSYNTTGDIEESYRRLSWVESQPDFDAMTDSWRPLESMLTGDCAMLFLAWREINREPANPRVTLTLPRFR